MASGTPLNTQLINLIGELKDPEYRRGFVEGHAKDSIAFQLRGMRKKLGLEQGDVAEKAFGNRKLQPMVSRYENPDYGKFSLSTLIELAAAFDVALVVHFAPFSELVDWDRRVSKNATLPANFTEELPLLEASAQSIPMHSAAPARKLPTPAREEAGGTNAVPDKGKSLNRPQKVAVGGLWR